MKTSAYINAASTISHQPTFREKGFSRQLGPLRRNSELKHPAYKDYIDPVLLRRMSKILRMGVTCSLDALKQADVAQPSGIIVGTGLGCLQDTEKFLNSFLTLEGLLPPTSFILSTHNTVAGQISLTLGCHAYNVTHTQNTLSFEMALLDGIMKLEEGESNLLVGAADEHIPFLENVAKAWGHKGLLLTSGASFFVLSDTVAENSLAEIADIAVFVGGDISLEDEISRFLLNHNLSVSDLDLLLGSSVIVAGLPGFNSRFVKYTGYSGIYPTASAFALHYGADFLQTSERGGKALIINELNPGNLGLILLKAVEA